MVSSRSIGWRELRSAQVGKAWPKVPPDRGCFTPGTSRTDRSGRISDVPDASLAAPPRRPTASASVPSLELIDRITLPSESVTDVRSRAAARARFNTAPPCHRGRVRRSQPVASVRVSHAAAASTLAHEWRAPLCFRAFRLESRLADSAHRVEVHQSLLSHRIASEQPQARTRRGIRPSRPAHLDLPDERSRGTRG